MASYSSEYLKAFREQEKKYGAGLGILVSHGLMVSPAARFKEPERDPHIVMKDKEVLRMRIGPECWLSRLRVPEVASTLNRMWFIVSLLDEYAVLSRKDETERTFGGIGMNRPIATCLESRHYGESLALMDYFYPGTVFFLDDIQTREYQRRR